MLPISNLSGVSALSPAQLGRVLRDSGPLLEVSPLPARLPDLKLGEQVTARVVDALPDNRFIAMVKNQLLTLNLSRGQMLAAEPGSTLRLTVAQLTPKLMFQLAGEPLTEKVDRQYSRVTLSGASRYLGALLLQAGRGGNEASRNQATPMLAREPLLPLAAQRQANAALTQAATAPGQMAPTQALSPLPGGMVSTRELAGLLKQLVSGSGVFYKSHLAQWVNGEKPLAEVKTEPQARLELPKAMLSLLDKSGQEDGPEASVGQPLRPAESDTQKQQNANTALGQLLARQLDTLEHRQVLVQGQAWPSQPFDLLIEEDKTQERDADGTEAPRQWISRLALDLPQLGAIEARITLSGQGVQLRFDALNPETAARLAGERERLRQGMQDNGLTLLQYAVNREA